MTIRGSKSDWNLASAKAATGGSVWSLSSSPRVLIRRLRKGPLRAKKHHRSASTLCGPCICGDINATDDQGRALLFYAARYNQVDAARQLLEAGCNPNQADTAGRTALHEAVKKCHLDVVTLLLTEGAADVSPRSRNGHTPVMVAVWLGQLGTVKLLHMNGASLNECDMKGLSPLRCALQRGWEDVAGYLLDNHCDVNAVACDGETAFYTAMTSRKLDHTNMAKRFLKTDYDFSKDTDWLLSAKCPAGVREDEKLYEKVLERSGLIEPSGKSRSLFQSGKARVKHFLCKRGLI